MQDPGSSRGVNVAVESQSEWQINYIQYDGTECFEPPPNFADIVAKNVSKIKWQDVIENTATLDNDDQDEINGGDDIKKVEKDLLAFDSVREAARDRVVPTAGPWAGVAKCLHESLQEVNVLLDTLRITKTQYLNVLQVAPPNEENRPVELLNKAKSFLWVSRRKAFAEALNILEVATKARQYNKSEDRTLYFNELRKMRENWRIRKVNDFVFGDLGYRIYGPKFAQGELFDIFWEPKPSSSGSKTTDSRKYIQVQVPKNLMRRTKLAVSLVKDEPENQDKIFDTSSQSKTVYYADSSRNLPWETTLKWAQESLINRDIFTLLMKEAVDEKHICIVTENSIVVCLLNGMLLKIEQKFYPFQEMEIPQTDDPYLTKILRDYFVRDIIRPPHRPQQFVGLPITTLPENLDFRGPQGMSAEEIASRMDKHVPLLTRMVEVANHYVLTDQVTEVLNKQMLCKSDPQLTWRWVRASANYSLINGTLTNQCYDNMGKMTFIVKISANEVLLVTKDNLVINCHRQMSLLQETLNLMSATCQLLSASLLAKLYSWQILHTNTNAFCKEGSQAPTFFACNQAATRKLFIQFFTDGRPYQIRIAHVPAPKNGNIHESTQDTLISHHNNVDDSMEGISNGDSSSQLQFVNINSARIPGESFLRKLDYIYTMFSS